MDMSLATSIMASKQAATQQTMQISMVKKQHEMEMSLVQMIDDSVRSAPQPGQGTQVDKIA